MIVRYYTLVLVMDGIAKILEEQYSNREQATLCRAGDINVKCPTPIVISLQQFMKALATAREVRIIERSERSIVFEVIPY